MRLALPALLLLALLACSGSKPEYSYDSRAEVNLSTFQTVAFDPRDLVWLAEGQRPVRAEHLKPGVQEALQAHGYRWAPSEEADLWVDVLALAPEKGSGSHAGAPRGGHGGGHGRSGGGMHGGGGMGRGGMNTGEPAPQASASPHPTPHGGLDLSGELTLSVKVLTRSDARTVWVGSVQLPAPGKGEWRRREAELPEILRRLVAPLPRQKGAGTP